MEIGLSCLVIYTSLQISSYICNLKSSQKDTFKGHLEWLVYKFPKDTGFPVPMVNPFTFNKQKSTPKKKVHPSENTTNHCLINISSLTLDQKPSYELLKTAAKLLKKDRDGPCKTPDKQARMFKLL